MTFRVTKPFCDYLNVTCHPEDSFVPAMLEYLVTLCCPLAFQDEHRIILELGHGKIVIDQKPRFHCVSASGSCLAYLRNSGELDNYLSVLGTVPHKVTRLDAAVDIAVDAPIFLRMLESKYPDDRVKFTRKSLKVSRLYSARESDGQQSGSWYAGNYGKARLTAKVYDKQLEALDKRGESLPPTTRIELTFAKDFGCTLKDASMPASLFYTHSTPLLESHGSVVPWTPSDDAWTGTPVDSRLTYEIYLRRLQTSPEIAALVNLAIELGPEGKSLLLRNFEKHFDAALRDHPSQADKLGIAK